MPAFLHRTREVREAAETALAPAATRSAQSRGRARPEEPDPHRTAFERDRDRILHTKAFRRLKHKTQVFIDPTGDHYVTRLTHTLQVTQIARALAAALGLNEALAEAIALGHDVGHSPFGHTGEEALSPYVEGGWHHAAQSVRIFEVLEDRNLTWEVRDGIRAHSWKIDPPPATPEAGCVRFADRIAYLSHDVLDAVRAGVLDQGDLPGAVRGHLGEPGSGWVDTMVRAVIDHSVATGALGMHPTTAGMMAELRAFMFETVYHGPRTKAQRATATQVVRDLVEHHLAHPEQIPASYRDGASDPVVQTVDYVAGMTDRYATALHARLGSR
ncbi:MAG: HD domain-containing protein [Egibacteraceae bacterium]